MSTPSVRPATAASLDSTTPSRTPELAASARHACKVYGAGDTAVIALDDVTLDLPQGQFTAIMGPSGSGKSTLMHCMAGLDTLTSGQALIGGTERTRELGLLRAVGGTRRQVRAVVRRESVLISLLGALTGIALGVLSGIALSRALVEEGVTTVAIPITTLAIYLLVAVVVGVLAAVGPARRASKVDVLRAITTE